MYNRFSRSAFWIQIFAVQAFHTYWMWRITAVRKQLLCVTLFSHTSLSDTCYFYDEKRIIHWNTWDLQREKKKRKIIHFYFIHLFHVVTRAHTHTQCIRASPENGYQFLRATTNVWPLCPLDFSWTPETIQSFGGDPRKLQWFGSLSTILNGANWTI